MRVVKIDQNLHGVWVEVAFIELKKDAGDDTLSKITDLCTESSGHVQFVTTNESFVFYPEHGPFKMTILEDNT